VDGSSEGRRVQLRRLLTVTNPKILWPPDIAARTVYLPNGRRARYKALSARRRRLDPRGFNDCA